VPDAGAVHIVNFYTGPALAARDGEDRKEDAEEISLGIDEGADS